MLAGWLAVCSIELRLAGTSGKSDSWLQPLLLLLLLQAQPNFVRGIYLSIAAYRCVCLVPIFVYCPNKSLASEQPNNENCCLFSARIYDPMSTARTASAKLLMVSSWSPHDLPMLLFWPGQLNRPAVKSAWKTQGKLLSGGHLTPVHRLGLASLQTPNYSSNFGSQLQGALEKQRKVAIISFSL